MNTNLDNSCIKISDDVISSIVSIAINEIDGVKTSEPSISDKLTKNNPVQITKEDEGISIDASVTVAYGLKIQELIPKVQENIATNLFSMTSLKASQININVVNIYI